MNYRKQCLFSLFVFVLPFIAYPQANKKIDSIKEIIKHIPENNKIKRAAELVALGDQYEHKSDYPTAMDLYQQSLDIAQSINNDSLTANCYQQMAIIAWTQRNYDRDSLYAFTALNIYRKINNKEKQGEMLKSIGASYLTRGMLPEAKKYYAQALPILQQLNKQQLVAGVYSNLAVVYKTDYKKSIELELAAKRIWDKHPADGALPIINTGNLGVAYFYMVRYDSLKHIKPDSNIAASPSKNLKIAEQYIRQAIQMAKNKNYIENQAYYTEILSELQYYKGEYKSAYDNFEFYDNVNDSIYSQANKNKVAELENRNEIQQKNQEILKQKLDVQTEQRNVLLLLSGLLIVLLIGAFFYRLSIVRKHKNEELVRLNAQLDEANKLKSKFFAIITHDLRSPIARLVNFFQLQKRDAHLLTEAQKAEQETKITKSALSLLDVMEEILLWSKGQMENFEPENTNEPVKHLFLYLKEFFAGVLDIKFNYIIDEDLSVYTDVNYLKTIMHNLTQNAVNALKGKQNAEILWKAWKESGKIKLSITDNGAGLSADQIRKFEENTMVGSSKHGLGLNLVKDMAHTIGCIIEVDTNQGSGTTFILSLNPPVQA